MQLQVHTAPGGTGVGVHASVQVLPELGFRGGAEKTGGDAEPGTQLHVQVAPGGIGDPQGSV